MVGIMALLGITLLLIHGGNCLCKRTGFLIRRLGGVYSAACPCKTVAQQVYYGRHRLSSVAPPASIVDCPAVGSPGTLGSAPARPVLRFLMSQDSRFRLPLAFPGRHQLLPFSPSSLLQSPVLLQLWTSNPVLTCLVSLVSSGSCLSCLSGEEEFRVSSFL